MEQQSKNQCLLNNRTESHSFFILWKNIFQLSKIIDSISLESDLGKFLLERLKNIGRKKIKKRGKLFVTDECRAKTLGDLLINRGEGVINIPFHLIILLKEVTQHQNNNIICQIDLCVEKIISSAYKVAEENNLIIDIVYRKLLLKYRNIYTIKEDVFTEGFLGLMHAVYSYKPEKKVKFETYAYMWCWKYMFEYAKKYLFGSTNTYEYNDRISIVSKKKGGKKQMF